MHKISYSVVIGRNGTETSKGFLIHIEAYQAGRKVYFSSKIHVARNQFSHGLVVNHPLADRYNAYKKGNTGQLPMLLLLVVRTLQRIVLLS